MIEEQQQHLKILEDLMADKDTVDISIMKIFLVGPPRAGKTTTLKRLLKPDDNISKSGCKCQCTLLANCHQVIAFATDSESDWLSSDDAKEQATHVYGCLSTKIKPSATTEENASKANDNQ